MNNWTLCIFHFPRNFWFILLLGLIRFQPTFKRKLTQMKMFWTISFEELNLIYTLFLAFHMLENSSEEEILNLHVYLVVVFNLLKLLLHNHIFKIIYRNHLFVFKKVLQMTQKIILLIGWKNVYKRFLKQKKQMYDNFDKPVP
jgi:hypothetical protein